MTSLIVASFTNEEQAIAASHKLTELESFGDISVFERVIVRKNPNGEPTILQSDTSEGVRTVSGMTIGSLLGAFAGPVGLMIGMASGTLAGAALESDHFSFAEDFGSKAIKQLQPGSTAIIAEVDEDSPVFIDSALTPLGANISRSDVDYQYDEYMDDQIEEIDEDIAAERAKIKSAAASEKNKIQQKIAQLKSDKKRRIADIKENQKQAVAKITSWGKEKKFQD